MTSLTIDELDYQLNEQYMEDEIKKILEEITPSEYKSLKEIEELKELVIDKIYSEFTHYPINEENKKEAKELLKSYELVEIKDIKKGNYIKYFDLKIFYNLKLITGGSVLEVFQNGKILVRKGNKFNTLKPNFFFRKLSEDALIKMKLLEIVNE
jgi:hypothetical protein